MDGPLQNVSDAQNLSNSRPTQHARPNFAPQHLIHHDSCVVSLLSFIVPESPEV